MRTQLSVITIALVGLAAPVANAAATLDVRPDHRARRDRRQDDGPLGLVGDADARRVQYRVAGTCDLSDRDRRRLRARGATAIGRPSSPG